MAARASEAEKERDAAAEEAALAIFALQRVQKELEELKRSIYTTTKQHDQRTQEDTEKDAVLEHKLHEIRGLQHRLDEKDSQIKQLLKMVEIQAAVTSAEPGVSQEDHACNFRGEQLHTTGLRLGNHCCDGYDEFEASMDDFQPQNSLLSLGRREVEHASSGRERQRIGTSCEEEEKANLQNACENESAETIRILQAQLEMYVRYFQRKNTPK